MLNELLYGVGEKAKSIIAITSVLALVISGLWYVFRLETRLQTVEAQIQALALGSGSEPTKQQTSNNATPINPIAQVCADLALRAAELKIKTEYVAANGIQDLMEKLGCMHQN